MSFNIFKLQVNYCLLNKEDNELERLRNQRESKNFAPSTNITNIKENNEKFFEMKHEYENKISNQLLSKLKSTEDLPMFPTRVKENDKLNKSKSKSKQVINTNKSKSKTKQK
jgi:hypothetical protein